MAMDGRLQNLLPIGHGMRDEYRKKVDNVANDDKDRTVSSFADIEICDIAICRYPLFFHTRQFIANRSNPILSWCGNDGYQRRTKTRNCRIFWGQ